jgi:hypothetical protein
MIETIKETFRRFKLVLGYKKLNILIKYDIWHIFWNQLVEFYKTYLILRPFISQKNF